MNIAGKWNLELSTPMGPHTVMADFSVDGEHLGGTMNGESMCGDIDGTVKGNKLIWSSKVTKPMAITLTFDVEVAENRMAGSVKFGMFASGGVTGTRV